MVFASAGYLAPEQEQEFINEVASNEVRYVLIANRNLIEYGVAGFLNDSYNHSILSMDYGELCEGRAIWATTCCTVPPLHRVRVRKEGARAKSLNGRHLGKWDSSPVVQEIRREMNLASPFSSGSNSVIQKNVVRHGLLGSEPLKLFWLRSPVACFD